MRCLLNYDIYSPVKDKVQHFERLAEAKNTEENGETKRVTRTKTRAMAVKNTEVNTNSRVLCTFLW